ncbi:MAG: hypothetical protein UT08_C0008G0003 [Candidatus Woesebacteria bacterium GW2011_GWB1_38_8]|uniref:UPF0102 protein UT08_C0008G0003 n=1 Tax=Candidatus Woesebacteria bacterium GW2011_GWB1_38_8 TaxID=1618570 RepID=A0A0G0L2L6_9BACT|nr:MAG: hypothetical protein UT08_C0008G0003 [Candidatus Woesebacteria bacterium GW2011_GWB1_38_8]
MKGKRAFGELGEDYAIKLLEDKGYKIISRNFRCRLGEIDIIAIDKDTLVFVEVKTRWSKKFGRPEEAVNFQKLYHIKRTADYFLLKNKNLPKKLRIDVVALEVADNRITNAKVIKVI